MLWLTTIVLILAQIPAVQGVAGGSLWGNYVMHPFLTTIGAQSILAKIMRVGPVVFYFTLIVAVAQLMRGILGGDKSFGGFAWQ